jgi:hypothetical protein
MARQEGRQALAHCHGYTVVASDGPVGEVETPLFPPHADQPDYLIIRVARRNGQRRPVVPTGLVAHVDSGLRVVRLRETRREIIHLPEYLPLAGKGSSAGTSA